MSVFSGAVRLRSVKFPYLGAGVLGRVEKIATEDVVAFGDNGLPDGVQTDDAGEVLTQPAVTLLTPDGMTLILHCAPAIVTAIGYALGEVGHSDLAVGDILEVQYYEDGEKKKGRTAPKHYRARIHTGEEPKQIEGLDHIREFGSVTSGEQVDVVADAD